MTRPPVNLASDLLPPDADPVEVIDVLVGKFGSGRWEGGDTVVLPGENPELYLDVHGDELVSVRPGPHFDPAKFEALRAELREALAPATERRVTSIVAFASRPVTTGYRAPGDTFQITPAPPQAPRPQQFLADHPFVLECAIPGVGDAGLYQRRRMRIATEWVWFLNAVLRDRITTISPRARWMWAQCRDENDPSILGRSHYSQEFYSIPEWSPPEDRFSELDRRLVGIPDTEYFSMWGLDISDLAIPQVLNPLVTGFQLLDSAHRTQFMHAARWLDAGQRNGDVHSSSGYVALVAAIESLVEAPASHDPCPACGRDMSPGPTRRFKDFVERFVPAPARSRGELDRLYSIRSSLVHGSSLLRSDDAWGLNFSPPALRESDRSRRLYETVKVALVNWLADRIAAVRGPGWRSG